MSEGAEPPQPDADPPGKKPPPRSKRSSRAKTWVAWTAALSVAALAGAYGPGKYRYVFPEDVRGSIILGSPTIYTRQRLVNDRLSQADWLEKQLKLTEGDKAKEFGSIDALSWSTSNLEERARLSLGDASATAESGGSKADSKNEQSNDRDGKKTEFKPDLNKRFKIEQTTLDRFLAMKNYRDKVRGELMHTLLDDRHDIAGNTIYRLGFDATVLGGTNSRKLAIIFANLKHDSFADRPGDDGADSPPRDASLSKYPNSGKDIIENDYKKIYKEFIENANKTLHDSKDRFTEYLSNGQEPVEVDRFISERICAFFVVRNKSNLPECLLSADKWALQSAESERDAEILLMHNQILDITNNLNKGLNPYPPNYASTTQSSPNGKEPRVDAETESIHAFNYCYFVAIRDSQSQTSQYVVGNSGREQNSRSTFQRIENSVLCPRDLRISILREKIRLLYILKYNEGSALDDIIEKNTSRDNSSEIIDSDRIAQRFTDAIGTIESILGDGGHSTKIEADNFKSLRELIKEKEKELKIGSSGTQTDSGVTTAQKDRSTAVSASSPGPWLELSSRFDRITMIRYRCAAGEYVRAQQTEVPIQEEAFPLDRYLSVRNEWKRSSECDLVVEAKGALNSRGADWQNRGQDEEPWRLLRDELDKKNEMFVYSVEPKNFGQRISTTDQLQQTISLGAAGNETLGGRPAMGAASLDTLHDNSFDEIENHALVLPLGEGGSSQADGSSLKGTGPYEIHFGWAIAPRLKPNGAVAQIDGTYALSVEISLPSWWRTLQAEYHMCWIDPSEIAPGRVDEEGPHFTAWDAEDIGELCLNEVKPKHFPWSIWASASGARKIVMKDMIRLPHSQSEVSRKLGFVFEEQPNLTEDHIPPLRAGFPGDIKLLGSRLWRSTDVFLNAQKADRIMVLPDMEGIVAHFNCVLPQRTAAMLTVVTSEGHALFGEPIEVESPPEEIGQQAVTPLRQSEDYQNSNVRITPAASNDSEVDSSTTIVNRPIDTDKKQITFTDILGRCAAVAEIGWKDTIEHEQERERLSRSLREAQK